MSGPLGLVACCGEKLEHAAPARELYRSPLFRLSVAYLERRGIPWAILSALHGLVRPDDVIEPYDVTLARMSAVERRIWTARVRWQLEPHAGDGFVVLAGELYRHAVEGFGNVKVPLRGLGIGRQLQVLSRDAPEAWRPAT